jgi:hypothetical protein
VPIKLQVFIYFVYDLSNDAVRSSDYIPPNDRIINKYLIVKDIEGSRRALVEGTTPAFICTD